MMTVDAGGRCLATNAEYARIFGTAPLPDYNLLTDDVEAVGELQYAIRSAIAGFPTAFQTRGSRLDEPLGARVAFYLTGSAVPLRDGRGRTAQVVICFRDVTAEHRLSSVDEALKVSEARFRATFEQAAVGIAHVGIDGRWLEVNQRLCEIVGYTREELLGRTFQDITHPADLEADLRYVRQVLDSKISTYTMQKRYVRKNGSLVFIELTVSLARSTSGYPAYFISVVQDVSERARVSLGLQKRTAELHAEIMKRRRAESALRRSEESLTITLDSIGDAVISADTRGLVTRINPAGEFFTGWSAAEARGQRLEQVVRVIRRQRAGGSSIPGAAEERDTILITRQGHELSVSEKTAPILNAAGSLRGFVVVLRDQTEERRSQAELQASQARFKHLSESGVIGIIIADLAGNIHEANEAFLQIVGYTKDDLLNGRLRWTDLTPGEWRDQDATAMRKMLATGVEKPREKEYLRKDGTRVPVLVGGAMLDDTRCIGVILDLTERERALELGAKAMVNAEVESAHRARVESALRQTEEQLRQSQKLEALGALTGGIAHDFNNLLSVILSYSALLLGNFAFDDPTRADLEQIFTAGERASQMTQQLLAFSRQQVLQPSVVSLNESMAGLAKMLPRLVGEDVEFTLSLDAQPGLVLVDPSQVDQVLLNLIVNAREAMPNGGKISVETRDAVVEDGHAEALELAPGEYVRLSVSDTGAGMDAETQARIFDPFFTTKPKGKGTGLGLATVFGIVKQSAGSVVVQSELGVGTVFRVYLPRAVGHERATEKPKPKNETEGGIETLLLAEDDEQVRVLASSILRRHGYKVIEAASGSEAVELGESYAEEIHLLVTDVVMPRMNGAALFERLRERRPDLRVLYMSGYNDEAMERHGMVSARDGFVQKPFLPRQLLEKVREALA